MKNLRCVVVTAAMCLWTVALPAATPPTVQSVAPPPSSTVSNLTQVTVTFSEAVTGVEAEDLLISGSPANSRSGGGNVWTFAFSQPAAGLVQFTWDGSHAIYNVGGSRFDELGPGATWSYTLADTIPPTVLVISPTPGAMIAALTNIEVTFKEPVTGLNASDLLVNGQAAASVNGVGAGPYLFSFTQPTSGTVIVGWASGHGIADLAPTPNAFAGGSWSNTLNPALTADVVINEIMADNLNGIVDENGDTSDWIELFNRGSNNVSLLGWSLTDDPTKPGQWVFPAITLNAGQYLLVFASGKDRATLGPLTNHSSFTLGSSEYLGLYNAQLPRQVVSEFAPAYPEQRGDISWGRTSSNTFAYFGTATPRAPNSSPTNYAGFAAMPHASVGSGLFGQPFNVALACETTGASIYYTLNNDVPTPTNATLYTGLISIAGNSNKAVVPLRAAAFKSGLLPSSGLIRTYIFPDQVLFQPIRPAGFPATWVSEYPSATADTPGDYEMDPQVLTNGPNMQIARQALAEIPTVSLVTSIDTAFGPTNGVYSGRRKQGNQRPVNAEMILPDGTRVFQADCGFEIQGGSSPTDASGDWKDKKLSMRLLFKGDFGTPKLHAKVFNDTPVEEFDTLILDAGLNFWWTHMTDGDQRNRAKFITDTVTSDLMNNAGMVAQHARYVHVYLDGLYWGLYFLHERMDESAAASYLGGQKEDWDVLKHTGDTAGLQNGTLTNYTAMFQLARSGLANNLVYEQLQSFLDLPWYIDYMIVNLWVGNTDWAQHNWYAWRRSRTPGSLPWRYVSWDAEHTFKSYTENRLSVADMNSPGEMFQLLRNNAEFRVLFGDHVHKLMFNGGPLYTTPDSVAFWSPNNPSVNLPATAYRKRVDEIWNSIVCESARWGDVATSRTNQPYTRELEYTRELNALFTITNISGQTPNYFPLRGSNVLAQFRAVGLYPSIAAPAFSRHGGRVAPGYSLYITNVAGVGTVYYTTNGADPRVFAAGTVSPQAVAYTGTPVALGETLTVRARTLSGTNWSPLNEATFIVGTLGIPLRITEVMYNPIGNPPGTSGSQYEFIELLNAGPTDLNLGGYAFEGVSFSFGPGFVLPAGTRIVLASGASPADFAARYPGVVVAGYFGGALNNAGERLAIKDAVGNTVLSIEYGNNFGWPPAGADGTGSSLELIDLNGDPDNPANWRASSVQNGTPGQPPSAPPAATILINEVMAENLTTLNNAGTYPDWVELYNAGGSAVNLTGWSLTDNSSPRRFAFTGGPVLTPGDYLIVWCDTNSAAPGIHTGFALDKDGDSVFLYDPNTNRIDAVSFGRQLGDYTIGRISGAWQLNTPTPGAANLAAGTGSATNLVINEWLANAPPGGSDWVELYNRSATEPVSLSGIYLGTSNAIFRYTALAFLSPGGFLQLLADEQPGARHLDFKLPAAGGTIVLSDTAGIELNRVTYGPQVEGVSQGRLPNGNTNSVPFPGSGSPNASNYALNYSGPILNELLARNDNGDFAPWGQRADWIEIANTNSVPLDLIQMGLSDKPSAPKWYIPAGTLIPANGFLRIWCESGEPASTGAGGDLNTGFSLSAESGGVYLFNTNGQVVDMVEYGFQVSDLPIGRSGGGWRLLSSPTPNAANAAPAVPGSAADLRINEWSSASLSGNDWFELFNRSALPVELAGLYLSDDPSLPSVTKYQVAPLSFIGGHGFVKFEADGDPSEGRNHANFNLDALGESLRLYGTNLATIDAVDFGPVPEGASSGRLPDGSANIVTFPLTPTPGGANYLPLSNALVNEVLTHTDPPLEDAIEIYNPTGGSVDLSGWFLSNSDADFKKYRIPDGTLLPAGGYRVFYETQFNNSGAGSFTLNSAHGDQVFLSEADSAGNLSGYRSIAHFGAAENGVSFGRFDTCVGTDFTALGQRTFGQDAPSSVAQFRTGPGGFNAYPKVGPVVINELMYHPPDIGGTNDDTLDEFVELFNFTANAVPLYDPLNPANTWQFRSGVSFIFPTNVTLPAGGYLLLVSFNPASNPTQLAAFRSLYGVGPAVPIVGPYSGKLDNGGESVELYRPDAPQMPPHPDAGFVPYVLVDRVVYGDSSPWPIGGDGDGESLQRIVASDYGNDPLNWMAAGPTAGRTNPAQPPLPPMIVSQPVSRAAPANSRVAFNVSACGGRPLTYQWKFEGNVLAGATNPALVIASAQVSDAGAYSVIVSDSAGATSSVPATLTLMAPPVITTQPRPGAGPSGGSYTFTVTASGTGPLTYQWRFNGTPIYGATNPTLLLPYLQMGDVGDYSVVVSNPAGGTPSATAHLTVLIPPNITTQPQSQIVSPNSNVTFTVAATGTGTIRYQWQFNGNNINNATSNSLTILGVQLGNEGDYRVLVTDDITTIPSAVARLTVKVAPVVLVAPKGATNYVGSNLTFTVTCSGSVPMGFDWRKGAVPVTNIVLMTTNCSFTLFNVQTNASSSYRVVITNSGSVTPGVSPGTFTVLVMAPPLITNQPISRTVAPGSNVTFSVGADGFPTLAYQWYFNGSPLGNATNTILSLTNVQAANQGGYFVVVTNQGAVATSQTATLTVLAPPILSEPEILTNGFMRFKLQGNTNQTYFIEISSNITQWTTLTNLLYTNGLMPFTDSTTPGVTNRFYRARLMQ